MKILAMLQGIPFIKPQMEESNGLKHPFLKGLGLMQFDRSGYGIFVDINFLNEKEGVAAYMLCDPSWITGCGAGLVTTKDGESVGSIFQ